MKYIEIIIHFLDALKISNIVLFLGLVIISLLGTIYIPVTVNFFVRRFATQSTIDVYEKLIEPKINLIKIIVTLILISSYLSLLKDYQEFYNLLRMVMDVAIIVTIVWLCSRLWGQFIRVYGVNFLRELGYEIDGLVVIAEIIGNILIGVVAAFAFAVMRKINLIAPLTGIGIGGLAIAFAAQKTLEQLLGALVLYLDKPFIPGEYIRIPSSQLSEGLFGRVESIGLRSTKIRTAAKGTLIIVPNSTLANLEIENITRGKKVMVLLYLDFNKQLIDKEQALVKQVIQESTNAIPGIDPGSTNISISEINEIDKSSETGESRARVTFFILGSSENSIELRKRLLELANEKVTLQLKDYGLEFEMQEPNIYVESPITI